MFVLLGLLTEEVLYALCFISTSPSLICTYRLDGLAACHRGYIDDLCTVAAAE